MACAGDAPRGVPAVDSRISANQIALDAFRGQRVFLELHIEGQTWWPGLAQPAQHTLMRGLLAVPPPEPPVTATLLVDDIQIR